MVLRRAGTPVVRVVVFCEVGPRRRSAAPRPPPPTPGRWRGRPSGRRSWRRVAVVGEEGQRRGPHGPVGVVGQEVDPGGVGQDPLAPGDRLLPRGQRPGCSSGGAALPGGRRIAAARPRGAACRPCGSVGLPSALKDRLPARLHRVEGGDDAEHRRVGLQLAGLDSSRTRRRWLGEEVVDGGAGAAW